MKTVFAFLLAALLPFFAFSSLSLAAEPTSFPSKAVQWAGVSLSGDFAQSSRFMPTVHELMTQDPAFAQRFQTRVTQAVSQKTNLASGLQILVEDQMRQGDDAYALTFVLAGESVTAYAIEQTTFVDYVVQALLLVGNVSKDPSKQRVVSSYPVQVKYQRAYLDGRLPSPQDRKAVISGMLMGRLGQADLVAEWQKRLEKVQLREREVWIAVAPLQILPEARQQGGFTPEQADRVAFKVSSAIEGNISRAADIPIVPSSFGGALDALTLSFADRGIVAFRRPDPSYALHVSVYALGSRTAEEAMTRETKYAVAYGGGFLVEYFSIDPDRRRTLELSMRLQSVQSVTYLGTSKDAHRATQADMYSRLVAGFAEELSNNLVPANVGWIEKYKASSELRSPRDLARLVTSKLPAPRK
jgi:hypothetical protein